MRTAMRKLQQQQHGKARRGMAGSRHTLGRLPTLAVTRPLAMTLTPSTSHSCSHLPAPPAGPLQKEVELSHDAAGAIGEAPLRVLRLQVGRQRRQLRTAVHCGQSEVHAAVDSPAFQEIDVVCGASQCKQHLPRPASRSEPDTRAGK